MTDVNNNSKPLRANLPDTAYKVDIPFIVTHKVNTINGTDKRLLITDHFIKITTIAHSNIKIDTVLAVEAVFKTITEKYANTPSISKMIFLGSIACLFEILDELVRSFILYSPPI